ncbi:MAG: Gfo/Idh/MocA family oxidoreductase [Gemmataceae bacterium]|nr:Gfo/Idh/MocA family oxidoreductase [Gemmataceae bacterium]
MSQNVNRRHFLMGAAAAGVALTQSSSAKAQDTLDKLIVGVMGTGGRGQGLAQTFQRLAGVDITYVCDADQNRAEQAAGVVQRISNRAPRAITDYRRMLDDRNVDIVVVATCNHWHAPGTIAACNAGKHVYVEKPCSHNPREGELMVQAARKHKRHVQMGNQRRSWPRVIEAMDELRKGVIGRVYFAQAWYTNNRPSIGRGKEGPPPKSLDYDLWQGPAPRRPYRSNYLHYNWHWFWHWGNGELGNNGVHSIDLCRWGLGVNYPIKATSAGGRYRYEDDQETPDTHVVSFEFEGRKMISWEGLSCSRPRPVDHVRFHGENGILSMTDSEYVITDAARKEVRRVPIVTGDAMHVENFLNAIRNNTRLNSEIEEGHKSTLLCHLGNIAQRTGRTLHCNAANGHIDNDKAAMGYWSREYEKGWDPRVM